MRLIRQMLYDLFVDPQNARKTWAAGVTIVAFALKHWGLDIGPIANALTEAAILLLNPLLVYWLANRSQRLAEEPEEPVGDVAGVPER